MTEFIILGCALSNVAADAYPFAVVFRNPVGDKAKLECYLLHNWQNYNDFFPDNTRETILDLIDDLRDYPDGQPSDRLFKHLKTLNFGYVRLLEYGLCKDISSFANEVSAYFEAGTNPVSWPESFRKM